MPEPTSADQLELWVKQEEQVKQRIGSGVGFGVADPLLTRTMSGLQMMQAMLAGQLPAPTISQSMDFVLIEVEHGRAVFQGRPGPAFLNPMGSLHGGWYATILDSALGCAVHTTMPIGRGYTTAELSVNLVKGIHPAKLERVRAIGEVLHVGRQLATAQAKLVGPDGTLYAHATTTCLVFELPK